MNVHSTTHSRSGRGLLIAGSVAGVAILLAACGGAGTAKAPAASSAALATPTKAAAAAAVTKAVTETSAVTSTVKTEAAPAKTTAITETKAMTEAAGAAKTAAVTETKVMTEAAAAAKTAAMTETKATTETTTGTTTGAAAAALVMLADNGTHGKILTDGKGMALYIFDKDSKDKSACTGDCLTKWPPLTVAAAADLKGGEGVTGKLATIKREDDGKLQVTINGMPLYHYYEDKQPGDAKGQAVGDVWWLVGADGSKISK
jgi:predicted lipoprotein with Yx(FWY)xxD motif